IRWPSSRSPAARLRRLLAVHSSGAVGSPRVVGSTKSLRSASSVGSVTIRGLRPPPFRQRFGGRKPTSPALIQHRVERCIAQFDRHIVNHSAILYKLRGTGGIP